MPDFSGYFVAHPPPFTAMIHTPERVVISRVGEGAFHFPSNPSFSQLTTIC